MSKYSTDLDYSILDIDISREELEEIKAEADRIISENKESNEKLAVAYLKKAQCLRKLSSGGIFGYIFYDDPECALLSKKEEKGIKKLLEKTLELSPDMPEALMQLGLFNNDDIFTNKRNKDKALYFFNRAIQLKPDYAAAFNNRAMLFFRYYIFINKEDKDKFEKAKIDYKNAVADLTEAIKIRPFDVLYHLNRGTFHSRLGEHKEAAKDFSDVINYASGVLKEQLMTDVLILELRGNEYNKLKEYSKKLDDFYELYQLSLIPEFKNSTCHKTNKEIDCSFYKSYSYHKCTHCRKCSFCGNKKIPKWKLKRGGYICLNCLEELSEKQKEDYMKKIIIYDKLDSPYSSANGNNYYELDRMLRPHLIETVKLISEYKLRHPEEFE
jgi:tetratricopeptide (TPR) repeat protein